LQSPPDVFAYKFPQLLVQGVDRMNGMVEIPSRGLWDYLMADRIYAMPTNNTIAYRDCHICGSAVHLCWRKYHGILSIASLPLLPLPLRNSLFYLLDIVMG
jgi:hypothetical protein